MRMCSIGECNNKYFCKDYCRKHYKRFWRYGDPLFVKQTKERHGMANTSEYRSWRSMKTRCSTTNHERYHRYVGRGITVCDRWLNSFLAFFADMGPKPFPQAQIDRIDNDGNYEPSNCRWTSPAENIRNSHHVKLSLKKAEEIRKLYGAGGVLQRELAEKYGIHKSVIGRVVTNKIWKL